MLPAKLERILQEGVTLQRDGRVADAAACFARVRAAAAWSFEGWHHGGIAALLLGRADEAVPLLSRALQLKPGTTHTALALGVARTAAGDTAGAEEILRRVVTNQPALAEGWQQLGFALHAAGKFADAVEAHRRAIALAPGSAQSWHACGSTLLTMSRDREALDCFERALALDHGYARARLGRAMTLYKTFRVAEAAAEYAAVCAQDARLFEAWSGRLLALNALPDRSREEIFVEHRAAGAAMGESVVTNFSNPPEPGRRLCVAFLSPDLREHSVAYFLEPLLRHLDAAEFELVLYHDHPSVDATSRRLRELAALWRNFAGQTDPTVEAAIRADAPDILIDLAGHTGLNRLPLLARRLAPVQVSYLGYPNTTGVAAIDYRFVDACTDPAGEADAFATERLVRFAPTAWTYAPPANAPAPALRPSRAGGPVTFGSFNSFTKITDAVLQTWRRVLDAVPGSRLHITAAGLSDAATVAHVRDRLRVAGLGDERTELLAPTADPAAHLALYGRIDVALDPFPYNGTTTTCEALWMGVPIISLAGDRHASRVGLSLLTVIGHPEWVAATPGDYVRIAAALASDSARLESISRALRDELQASPLLDHAGQATHFGAALRTCWENYCDSTVRQPELAAL